MKESIPGSFKRDVKPILEKLIKKQLNEDFL